jgi:hypothetical protein
MNMNTAPAFAEDPAARTAVIVHAPVVGQTVLELLAKPVLDYGVVETSRPLVSTPTQQRTWNQQGNHPDSSSDISQE